ncbi:MAG TPA: hypothetical protein VIW02_05735, partial [Gammaproteobacteria bacterium]
MLLAVLLLLHLAVYGSFFLGGAPVGGDYGYFLPILLDQYFWTRTEGLFASPWFTPGMCAGSLLYVNPQSLWWSLPHLLTLFVDPLLAVYGSVMVLAAGAALGMHLYLVRLGVAPQFAGVAGVLMATSGFLVERALVGHFAYLGVALLPLLASTLLPAAGSGPRTNRLLADLCAAAGFALLLVLLFHGGIGPLAVPVAVALLGLMALALSVQPELLGRMLLRASLGTALALLLLGPKLHGVIAFLGNFPRDIPSTYFIQFQDAFALASRYLFGLSADFALLPQRMTPWEFLQERHEFDYRVTWLPLALVLIALGGRLARLRRALPAPARRRPVIASTAAVLVCVLFLL